MNIYNNDVEPEQQIYDNFNGFIFAPDSRIFNKLTKRIELYLKTEHIVGDIIECGVFKGSGVSVWLKLKKMYEPNSSLKVIGLDYFNITDLISNIDTIHNKEKMNNVINRVDENDLSISSIENKLNKIDKESLILLQGDAGETTLKYVSDNPGLKIKLLYMDLDLGEPTYKVIKNLWNSISEGGIIVFDEYGYHCWDETKGVDKFLKEIPKESYKLIHTKIACPTLYLIKLVI
jgi:hypothetical protein